MGIPNLRPGPQVGRWMISERVSVRTLKRKKTRKGKSRTTQDPTVSNLPDSSGMADHATRRAAAVNGPVEQALRTKSMRILLFARLESCHME